MSSKPCTTTSDKGGSDRQVEHLRHIGLMVEPFGPDLWTVRTVPAPLRDRPDCEEALRELSQNGNLDAALVATACRTAIRNGTPLETAAMQQILNAWQRTRQPQTCPHGRPICLTLNESSLARYFRRSWVIGKSHGLEPQNLSTLRAPERKVKKCKVQEGKQGKGLSKSPRGGTHNSKTED